MKEQIEKLKVPPVGAGRQPHLHRPALQGAGGFHCAPGQIRTDRRSPGIQRRRLQGQGRLDSLGIDVHPLVVPDTGHDRPAPLLNDVADLIDKGVLRTTLDQTFGTINAANLKRAHALLESRKIARQDRAGGLVGGRNQAAAGSLPRMSDSADNSRSICPSVPTVIRR